MSVSVPSSELGPPTPSPPIECVSPLGTNGGSNTLLRVRVGGHNSEDWIESLALYIICATRLHLFNSWFFRNVSTLLFSSAIVVMISLATYILPVVSVQGDSCV